MISQPFGAGQEHVVGEMNSNVGSICRNVDARASYSIYLLAAQMKGLVDVVVETMLAVWTSATRWRQTPLT